MDTKKRKRKWGGTSGLLSLEASIALTMFIFLMLFMCSFFVVFEARNQMAHVMLTTADSLALDSLANETPSDNSLQGLLYQLYDFSESDGKFTENEKWYDAGEERIEEVIETRFMAYLANGDKNEADRILESLNIEGGMDGLDFSESKVEGEKLYLVVKYKLNYEFQFFGIGGLQMSQSCCSKLWK